MLYPRDQQFQIQQELLRFADVIDLSSLTDNLQSIYTLSNHFILYLSLYFDDLP